MEANEQDGMIIYRHAPAVRQRAEMELKVVRAVIADLRSAGFVLRISDGHDYGEGAVSDEQAIDEIFNLDEAYIHCFRLSPEPVAWIHLVMGNDGWDVVCDYTTNLEPVLTKSRWVADLLSGDYEIIF